MSSQKRKSESHLDWNSRLDEPNKKKKLKMKKRAERVYVKEKTENKKEWQARKFEKKKALEEKAKQKEERILIKEAKFKYKSQTELNKKGETASASQSTSYLDIKQLSQGKFPIEDCQLDVCPKKQENNKDRSRRRSLQKIHSIEVKYRRPNRSSSESSNSSRSRSPILFHDSDEEKFIPPTPTTSQENPYLSLLTGQLSKAFCHHPHKKT